MLDEFGITMLDDEALSYFKKMIEDGELIPVLTFLSKSCIKDYKPFVDALESYIDNEVMLAAYFGADILEELLPLDVWVDLCYNWKDDIKKERVVISSLQGILIHFIQYEPYKQDKVRDRAIELVKEISSKKGLDYESLTKSVNIGKDEKDKYKCKENTLKELNVLREIINPKRKIDLEALAVNLKKSPSWVGIHITSNQNTKRQYIYNYNTIKAIINRAPNQSRNNLQLNGLILKTNIAASIKKENVLCLACGGFWALHTDRGRLGDTDRLIVNRMHCVPFALLCL